MNNNTAIANTAKTNSYLGTSQLYAMSKYSMSRCFFTSLQILGLVSVSVGPAPILERTYILM